MASLGDERESVSLVGCELDFPERCNESRAQAIDIGRQTEVESEMRGWRSLQQLTHGEGGR